MAKDDLIEMMGIVNEVLPDSRYRVTLITGTSLSPTQQAKCVKTISAFWRVTV